jgi:hypothetical protein
MPTIAQSAEMKLRPFAPGEFVQNNDGSISTERSVTIQGPDGSWMNVPSLWMAPNGPQDFGTDEAAIFDAADYYERTTGKKFPRFGTVEEAVFEAENRSKRGGAGSGYLAK